MKINNEYDIVIIGGGPAGLISAYAAKNKNPSYNILVIERDSNPGGILPQCIHPGFGVFEFGEELTGPEYASRWYGNAINSGVEFLSDTAVLALEKSREIFKTEDNKKSSYKVVCLSGPQTGIRQVKAKSVILAMGCREKTRGAIGIPGSRCAGIYTAGCAQRLVNIEGYMPGKNVVILGSGDIGLIMARRITLEGGSVKLVCEKSDRPGGLERNVVQCLEDFNIPLLLSSTVLRIHGKKRVEAVTVGTFDERKRIIKGSVKKIYCDTLLLSVGLIPENEITRDACIEINNETNGPMTDGFFQTTMEGVFACGNVLKVYDLVDNVSKDSIKAGINAALYIAGSNLSEKEESSADEIKKTDKYSYGISQGTEDGKRRITCTICPVGCVLQIYKREDENYDITGYSCERGLKYAKDEITDPVRTLTTCAYTVTEKESGKKTEKEIAVRTDKPIPLSILREAAGEIRKTRILSEVKPGQVIIKNILATDANVIVTRA